jgi:hypothetical protein
VALHGTRDPHQREARQGDDADTGAVVLAWAWHTWWGAEVALRAVLPSDAGAGVSMGMGGGIPGGVELRASDAATCATLAAELPALLAQLTGGYVLVM